MNVATQYWADGRPLTREQQRLMNTPLSVSVRLSLGDWRRVTEALRKGAAVLDDDGLAGDAAIAAADIDRQIGEDGNDVAPDRAP